MGRFLANIFNRRFWHYGGLTEEEYEGIRPLVNQKNYDTWKAASILMLIFFTMCFASTIALADIESNYIAYIVMLIVSIVSNILFIYVLKPESKYLMPWIYFVVISLMAYAIHIGVNNTYDQVAVAIMVLLVGLPMMVLGRPHIMSLIIAGTVLVFCLGTAYTKTGMTRELDIYNAILFGVLSEFIHIYTIGSRFQGFKMQLIVEKNLSTDALTKVKNKNAYIKLKTDIDYKIMAKKSVSFGVVVCDINCLKSVNDQYGHEVGDAYIRTNCKALCSVFARSPVFRIGGDEFLVYLEGECLDNRETYFAQLEKLVNIDYPNISVQDKINFAYGFASYSPEKDKEFSDVFVRADEEMYKLKKEMHKR